MIHLLTHIISGSCSKGFLRFQMFSESFTESFFWKFLQNIFQKFYEFFSCMNCVFQEFVQWFADIPQENISPVILLNFFRAFCLKVAREFFQWSLWDFFSDTLQNILTIAPPRITPEFLQKIPSIFFFFLKFIQIHILRDSGTLDIFTKIL